MDYQEGKFTLPPLPPRFAFADILSKIAHRPAGPLSHNDKNR